MKTRIYTLKSMDEFHLWGGAGTAYPSLPRTEALRTLITWSGMCVEDQCTGEVCQHFRYNVADESAVVAAFVAAEYSQI